jgi:hypothetical protein
VIRKWFKINRSHLRYSDVIHEIKPIKSGYRLVLTYNLCFTGGAIGSAGAGLQASAGLDRIITNWTTAYNEEIKKDVPELLAYKLEHQYTNANLSFNALKGHDREVVKHLEAVRKQTLSHVYLASLEKTVSGSCDEGRHYDRYYCYGDDDNDGHHAITEEHEVTIKLGPVFNLDGSKFAEDIRVDEHDIVQEGIFDDREPDDEDYEGFTGNAGAEAKHYYRDTV